MRVSEEELRRLMIGGLGGEAGDYAQLLRLLVPVLRNFYRSRATGASDVCDDLIQETLIALHFRRSTYDRDRPFTAWLFAIARYKMIDHLRRTKQERPIEEVEAILLIEGFEDAVGARLDLERLLEPLSPKQAAMIRAVRLEGMAVSEAAAVHGIGESDVKISVHRGLKAVMSRIQGNRR